MGRDAAHEDPFRVYAPRVADHLPEAGTSTRHAVTMFVDVAGFTTLSERLASRGTAGTEQLGSIVRSIIGGALDVVDGLGGDTLAFGGDAITVAFDAVDDPVEAAWRAAAGIHELVAGLQGMPTLMGPLELSVRIGLAEGRVTTVHCPGTARDLFVHVGPGLDRAVEVQEEAPPGGVAADGLPDSWAHARPARSDLPRSWGDRLCHPVDAGRLRAGAVIPDEHRRVTATFVRFPPIDDEDPNAVARLRTEVGAVLDLVTTLGGDVLQCTGGDKGLMMYAVFGTPVAHPDGTRCGR